MERRGVAILAGDNPPGRDLIQQRLKQVIIVSVDKGYLNIGLSQIPCCFQATEAATNDHDMGNRGGGSVDHNRTLLQRNENTSTAFRKSSLLTASLAMDVCVEISQLREQKFH